MTLTHSSLPGDTGPNRAGAGSGSYEVCTDDALVALTRAGDEQAFDALVARHRPWLVRSCARWLGDAHEAQDVAQDVLIKTHTAIRSKQELRLRGWMSVVARRSCVDVLRKRRTALPGHLPERSATTFEPNSSDPHLDSAWNALSSRHREVLYYREIVGLSYLEIGKLMESSHSAIETLLHRARTALRREYERLAGRRTTWGAIATGLASLRQLRPSAEDRIRRAMRMSDLRGYPGGHAIEVVSSNSAGISNFLKGSGVAIAGLFMAATVATQQPRTPPTSPVPAAAAASAAEVVTAAPEAADTPALLVPATEPSQEPGNLPGQNEPPRALISNPVPETTEVLAELRQTPGAVPDFRTILDPLNLILDPLNLILNPLDLQLPPEPPYAVPIVGEVDPLAAVETLEDGVNQVVNALEEAVPTASDTIDSLLP